MMLKLSAAPAALLFAVAMAKPEGDAKAEFELDCNHTLHIYLFYLFVRLIFWSHPAFSALRFLQILCSMPSVMGNMPFPDNFTGITVPLRAINFDFLSAMNSLLGKEQCRLAYCHIKNSPFFSIN